MSEPDLTALRAARAALAKTRDAVAATRSAGFTRLADEMAAEADHLASTTRTARVPCLLCAVMFPMDVPVGADWSPSAVICGPCDARVNAEVRAECDRRFIPAADPNLKIYKPQEGTT